jgi:hypothetical protein
VSAPLMVKPLPLIVVMPGGTVSGAVVAQFAVNV